MPELPGRDLGTLVMRRFLTAANREKHSSTRADARRGWQGSSSGRGEDTIRGYAIHEQCLCVSLGDGLSRYYISVLLPLEARPVILVELLWRHLMLIGNEEGVIGY